MFEPALLQVWGVKTASLGAIHTEIVFRIGGGRWPANSDVHITFQGLLGHVVPDRANLGPTVTTDSIGSLNGYWGVDYDDEIIGPTAPNQQVIAVCGRYLGGCDVIWLES